MKRTLLVALALTSSLTACGSDGSTGESVASGSTPTPTATPSAEGPEVACTPGGTGTTDLKVKPVYTVTRTAAPTETTVTDIVCGSGKAARDGSSVGVKYVGVAYTTGEEFDASWSRGDDYLLPFTVGTGVVPGFSKGVLGMKPGGRRLVVIPPKDGYGDGGPVPGEALVFLIDMVEVG
jgi:peptidylprolyl isomerase